jgi:hypothetical protein
MLFLGYQAKLNELRSNAHQMRRMMLRVLKMDMDALGICGQECEIR